MIMPAALVENSPAVNVFVGCSAVTATPHLVGSLTTPNVWQRPLSTWLHIASLEPGRAHVHV
jgi:hypothetical protein